MFLIDMIHEQKIIYREKVYNVERYRKYTDRKYTHTYTHTHTHTHSRCVDAQVKMAQKDNMTLYIPNNNKKLYIVNSHYLQWLCSVKLLQTLN